MNTTALTLNQIISTSGDSTLLSYKYENQVLEFTLHHCELDRNIVFKVETSELRVLLHENYPNDTTSKTCFIVLLEIGKVLGVANHHYSKCQNKLHICKSKMLHLLLPNTFSKKSIG